MERKFNEWRIVSELGKGGNGVVYKVTKDDENFYALKAMKNKSSKSYTRFRDEILAIKNCKDISGIVEIFDHFLPEDNRNTIPYYVMPIGQPIQNFLWNKSPIILFELFTQITETLIELHKKDITHRDIKPQNILIINGKPHISDFGLVSYPKKNKITEVKESVGPRWTISPEMKRNSTQAQFKKADIYSLAKTLWILITRDEYGFEGQYDLDGLMSISRNRNLKAPNLFNEWNYSSTLQLEKLLRRATDNDPKKRPSAKTFLEELNKWLQTSKKFQHTNSLEWDETLYSIFPSGLPDYCEWTSIESITEILKFLTHFESVNHCFLPAFGGIDLNKIRRLKDKNDLIIDEYRIIKPLKLTFNSLGSTEWSFFRIILESQNPLYSEVDFERQYERLYIDKLDNYHFKKNKNRTIVNRYLSGSIIIVKKTSYFNQLKGDLDGYFGWHEKMTEDKYLEKWRYIKNLIEQKESLAS